jgi:hypothetical protein
VPGAGGRGVKRRAVGVKFASCRSVQHGAVDVGRGRPHATRRTWISLITLQGGDVWLHRRAILQKQNAHGITWHFRDKRSGVLNHVADSTVQIVHVNPLIGCQYPESFCGEAAVAGDFSQHLLRRGAGELAHRGGDHSTQRQYGFVDGYQINNISPDTSVRCGRGLVGRKTGWMQHVTEQRVGLCGKNRKAESVSHSSSIWSPHLAIVAWCLPVRWIGGQANA